MMKRILIADDDAAIVDATSLLLQTMGYEVSSTLNGALVSAALQNKPDLLLLDIWMSGIDGRTICKEIKANPSTFAIPVLMISASRDIRESAMSSGADDFLAKPFELHTLISKIEKLLA